MISFIPEAIQDYADAFSAPEPELFAELARETRATQRDPQVTVGHGQGTLLALLVRRCGAHRVLEVGTFTGYSALAMASGLPDDGELVTCTILADNLLWSGRVLDPKEEKDRALAAFNAHVKRDARVHHVMLPIRDGITLAVKR